MYIYIDESGNSGLNISDEAQPLFYAFSLQSEIDFEKRIRCQMEKIRNDIQCCELHGNELGIAKIDSIADSLLAICKKYNFTFSISIIEKKFLALAQLFDCLFDSGINIAVPYHVYNIFELRGLLLEKISTIINIDIVNKFWNGCIHEKNISKAHANMQDVCEYIIQNVDKLKDNRSREIVRDAMVWAKSNCSEFLPLFDKRHLNLMGSANFIAITMQFDSICKRCIDSKKKVVSIVHDEQSQFKKTFEFYYDVISKSPQISLLQYFCPNATLDFEPLKNCIFTMEPSNMHDGLQLVDLFLYLIKKFNEGKKVTGKAEELLLYILKATDINFFTFESFAELIEMSVRIMNTKNTSPELIKRGEELVQYSNKKRNEAMEEWEKNKATSNTIK